MALTGEAKELADEIWAAIMEIDKRNGDSLKFAKQQLGESVILNLPVKEGDKKYAWECAAKERALKDVIAAVGKILNIRRGF